MDNNIVEILLVEDNPHDAELAKLALEQKHLTNNLVWLKDGEQALNFLFGKGEFHSRDLLNQPKLILLDLKMPKVNGLEVLEEIRSDERTRRLPVVVLTSSKEEPDLKKAYELGVNSYIVKPVDFDKFSECVKEVGYYWMVINSTHPGIANQ